MCNSFSFICKRFPIYCHTQWIEIKIKVWILLGHISKKYLNFGIRPKTKCFSGQIFGLGLKWKTYLWSFSEMYVGCWGHHYILQGLKKLCGMHICTLYVWQCSDACQFGPKRNSSCIQTWLENKDTEMTLLSASWLSKGYKTCSIFVSAKSWATAVVQG